MYTINRILCPTDFSDSSLQAIRYAHSILKESRGSLTLFYVDEFFTSPPGYFIQDEQERELHRNRVSVFAKQKFDEIIHTLSLPAERTNTLIRYGAAYKEIVNEAEARQYSAVAISTSGIGQSSPHLVGRTAQRVARLLRTPLFTVNPPLLDSPSPLKTVLCPTDFSEYGNYALPYALSLARHHRAKLLVLHVADISVEHADRLRGRFPDLQAYHESAGEIPVEQIVDTDIDPANSIVRIAEQVPADLVVIGTHGARGMRRVQIGNTTEEVVRRITVPVLTVTHPIHKVVFPFRFTEEYPTNNGDISLEIKKR